MFVDHLQLADFRSYAAVDVALGSGVAIFVGANGQGKTNLVEAVATCPPSARTGSPLTSRWSGPAPSGRSSGPG